MRVSLAPRSCGRAHSQPAAGRGGDQPAEQTRQNLIQLRGDVIKKAFPQVNPARVLLRKSMLDALLRVKSQTREEWLTRISLDLRSVTYAEQVSNFSMRC
jgi:hypothetical protein